MRAGYRQGNKDVVGEFACMKPITVYNDCEYTLINHKAVKTGGELMPGVVVPLIPAARKQSMDL